MDYRIVIDCLTALLKLNPWNTLRSLMLGFFDGNAALGHSVILVCSCLEIVGEVSFILFYFIFYFIGGKRGGLFRLVP